MSSDAYIINGYRLINCVRAGQNSQVWEAIQEGTGRQYAVKMLHPEFASDPQQRKFMSTEAVVGTQLDHPKIIRIYDYYPDKKNPHFVMEYFPSLDMKVRVIRESDLQTIDATQRKQTTVLTDHAFRIIEQSAESLAYMHDKKWVHCDVKPDNFLVNGVGEVRLIDFALSKKLGSGGGIVGLFKKKLIQGTRSYMAPEQIRSEKIDQRTDVYGFGCTLFEMLTGKPPFRADSGTDLLRKQLYEVPRIPHSINKSIDPAMSELILQLLQKKKDDRVQNLHEFLAEFRRIQVFKA